MSLIDEIAEVAEWFNWAGQTLLAMKIASPAPRDYKAWWPQIIPDPETDIVTPRLRVPIPPSGAISLMDEIFSLVEVIPDPLSRRIVQARALVAPLNGKHLFSWRRLGQLLHLDSKTVQARWKLGIKQIVFSAPNDKMCRIRTIFVSATNFS